MQKSNELNTRYKPIDEQLKDKDNANKLALPQGIDEQLEINISGRKFSISLKGFEPNAIIEIKDLLNAKNVDLLDLIRAYLNSVHSKCELESQISHITQKLAQRFSQNLSQSPLQHGFQMQNIEDIDKEYSALEDDLVDIASNDFDKNLSEFGNLEEHSSEVYVAFGEFEMLGGFGIHNRDEILLSEEELDDIMAQKEQEANKHKLNEAKSTFEQELSKTQTYENTQQPNFATQNMFATPKKQAQNKQKNSPIQTQFDGLTSSNTNVDSIDSKAVNTVSTTQESTQKTQKDFAQQTNPQQQKLKESNKDSKAQSKEVNKADFFDFSVDSPQKEQKNKSKSPLSIITNFIKNN